MSDAVDARSVNLEELNFEQALEQLERIVGELESGKIGLDQALASYEVGVKLVLRCRKILHEAEKRVQMLVMDENGELRLEEFGGEAVGGESDSGEAPVKRKSRTRRVKGGSSTGEDHRRLIGDEDE